MNYKKVYDKIIENRLNTPLSETEYGEKHHIIPRSLGGSNRKDNLVRLSAREHFICHALLAEMYERETDEWYKMNHAFMMMKAKSDDHGGNRYFNSRLYELKRKDFSKVMSDVQSGNKNSQYGKVWIYNLELKQSIRISKAELGYYVDEGWKFGRILNFEKEKTLKNPKLSNPKQLRKSKLDSTGYKTESGYVINKYRRNKIKHIFNVDLENNFYENFVKLKKILYNLYVIENKSPNCIAKIFNTNRNTITSNLELCGIYIRNWKESKLVEDIDNTEVEQYDRYGNLLNVWKNATHASLSLGIRRRWILKCCNHRQHTFKGYMWKYKADRMAEWR